MITDLQQLRRELHAVPEVGLDLPVTQSIVLRELRELGMAISTGAALSSVTAVLTGTGACADGTRPAVLMRSDMDALPVKEDTGLPYAATGDSMHACGHDLHMAALLGAARALSARRDDVRGDVVFMFQPGEEAWGGAQFMLSEGVLEASGRRVDAALGVHVLSYGLPAGTFGFLPGAVLSGSNILTIRFHGRGGHGSAPHLAADPVPAAAEFISAVQVALSRGISMFEPVTLTFGLLRAGAQHNVIADTAEVGGTLRSYSKPVTARALALVHEAAHGVAAAHGLRAEIEVREDTIPTVCDPRESGIAEAVATAVLGDEQVQRLDRPYSISEDFSWVLDEVPGVFVIVGADASTDPDPPANHSPRALFDDSVVDRIARFETEWAITRLTDQP